MDTAKKYKIVGINDEQESCDCCGKTGLKKVVWLEEIETGSVRAFGTTCAAKAQGFTVKQQTSLEKAHLAEISQIIAAEIKPFKTAYNRVLALAPENDFRTSESLTQRLNFISDHPSTIAYNQKRKELAERFNLPVYKI
jgi:hypothetical protein